MSGSLITWEVARAGGLVAYLLLTASVSIGLVVSLRWRSALWTRFVTAEVHRFVTLLALVFTGIHTVAVAVDPFIGFALPEVVVPFLSHYRPLWVALGIVAAYLLMAVYASEWLRPKIGYAWWHRFHLLAFVALVLALIHGLGTGSDSRAPWAIVMYASSVILIGALIVVRAIPPVGKLALAVPLLGIIGLLVVGSSWAWQGPLQPGWNTVANDGHGSGGRSSAVAPSTAPATTAAIVPSGPFQDTFSGRLTTASGGWIVLAGTLGSSGDQVSFRFRPTDDGGLSLRGATVALSAPNGDTCSGPVEGADASGLAATCQGATSGSRWNLSFALSQEADGTIVGSVSADPSGG